MKPLRAANLVHKYDLYSISNVLIIVFIPLGLSLRVQHPTMLFLTFPSLNPISLSHAVCSRATSRSIESHFKLSELAETKHHTVVLRI